MTLLQNLGKHFVVGLKPGVRLSAVDRRVLTRLRPAGVVLFKDNFNQNTEYRSWLRSHRDLIQEIRDAVGRAQVLIAIDHEGGRVIRTPSPMTHFPAAEGWGKASRRIGGAMGKELASLGVNLNFAPVLDIHTNPLNPVIGNRAFGKTPQEVISTALPFVTAMEKNNVMACAKHFPGHGDTSEDSHFSLPTVGLSRKELRERELLPFKAAVAGGLHMVMTAHLFLPKLDCDDPVTLSRRLTHNLLRYHCKFRGVIISDDVGMGAMKGRLSELKDVAKFFWAGHDIMLVCNHGGRRVDIIRVAERMHTALERGLLDVKEVRKSGRRIDRLLDTIPQNDVIELPDAVFHKHRKIYAECQQR